MFLSSLSVYITDLLNQEENRSDEDEKKDPGQNVLSMLKRKSELLIKPRDYSYFFLSFTHFLKDVLFTHNIGNKVDLTLSREVSEKYVPNH